MTINPNNNFFNYSITQYSDIVNELKQKGTRKKIHAKETVLKEGEPCDFFFYVIDGCFRAYRYVGENEVTIGFSFKGDLDTCPYAFINNIPSPEVIEALTDSTIIVIKKKELINFVKDDPRTGLFINYMLSNYIETIINRIIDYKTFTAEDNYYRMLSKQPVELNKVPLKYLSAYLGITPERLSRIRKKLQRIDLDQ